MNTGTITTGAPSIEAPGAGIPRTGTPGTGTPQTGAPETGAPDAAAPEKQADKAGKPARLQAFAVVENLSGRDWNAVSVTLTSGRPVRFHTPLYQALFTERPEAPVAEAGGLAPRLDEYAAERNPLAP